MLMIRVMGINYLSINQSKLFSYTILQIGGRSLDTSFYPFSYLSQIRTITLFAFLPQMLTHSRITCNLLTGLNIACLWDKTCCFIQLLRDLCHAQRIQPFTQLVRRSRLFSPSAGRKGRLRLTITQLHGSPWQLPTEANTIPSRKQTVALIFNKSVL